MRRAAAIGAAITASDNEVMKAIQKLTDDLLACAAAGNTTATVELPIKMWLAIIDEIKGRRPRNYSQLVADDTIERFLDLYEKLGGQVSQLMMEVGDLTKIVERLEKKT